MAAKNRRLKAKCQRKVAYGTVDKANHAAVVATKKSGQTIWPYRCQFCGKMHIGHPPKTIRQAAASRAKAQAKLRGL